MKICIVNSFYYPDIVGGAEISVLKLAEGLAKCSNDVHVICTSNDNKIEVLNDVTIHRIKMKNTYAPITVARSKPGELNKFKLKLYTFNERFNLLNYRILYKTLHDINPDVVHVNNIHGIGFIIWHIVKKLNLPLIHTARDYSLLFEYKKNFISKISRIICKYLSKDVDVITAPSRFTLNKFLENQYYKKAKAITIYNAIDFNIEQVREILIKKKEAKYKSNKIFFVYVGRLTDEKGVKILLNSFKQIESNNIELLIAGNGPLKNFVQEYVKNDSRIRYLGFLEEEKINNLLLKADVLIIPSIWQEPFGRVIIEAYKYSNPVIGTKVGGIPEIIEDNFTGRLIYPNNEEDLKKAILYFSDKNNIINMMDNCVDKLSLFHIEKQVREFMEIYKEINK